jgi:hypothetical protein
MQAICEVIPSVVYGLIPSRDRLSTARLWLLRVRPEYPLRPRLHALYLIDSPFRPVVRSSLIRYPYKAIIAWKIAIFERTFCGTPKKHHPQAFGHVYPCVRFSSKDTRRRIERGQGVTLPQLGEN